MPTYRFNHRTCALLAVCFMLWGCPQAPGLGPSDDGSGFGGDGFPGSSTPRPGASATLKPTPSPTPSTGTSPSPTPSATPVTPQARIKKVSLLNPISQMWLLEETPTASPPVSIPATYSFQAEVVTMYGTLASTSSVVVWTSSLPAILSIDRDTGYASASVAQGLFVVTIKAATSNPAAGDPTVQSETMTITVGNSGTLDVTIE